jgi:hypothetical protein
MYHTNFTNAINHSKANPGNPNPQKKSKPIPIPVKTDTADRGSLFQLGKYQTKSERDAHTKERTKRREEEKKSMGDPLLDTIFKPNKVDEDDDVDVGWIWKPTEGVKDLDFVKDFQHKKKAMTAEGVKRSYENFDAWFDSQIDESLKAAKEKDIAGIA